MKKTSSFSSVLLIILSFVIHLQCYAFPQDVQAALLSVETTEALNPEFDNEDFGDAPETASGIYPTTMFHNGARHTIVPGIYLGSQVDFEPDGQPSIGADCDDTDCLFPSFGDDEDGVAIATTVVAGSTVNITVTASVSGYLDAWMDFNLVNGWADAGEHIFINTALSSGLNNLSFNVPANAVSGQSYVRFRFRDIGIPISFDGLVINGEVEDYAIMIQENTTGNIDFGDVPENTASLYPTTLANNGARHTIVPGIFLGSFVDPEPDGQPGPNASCDDTDCLFPSMGDDEDGVVLPASVTAGSTVNITVSASVAGFLDAWMDFNLVNSWADAGEHIFVNEVLVSGVNVLTFSVPPTATTGQSFIRFRFRDSAVGINYIGLVDNGEVEDYSINIGEIEPGLDFGDAPDNIPFGGYPTLLVNNGARHFVVPGIFLGSSVDPEPDGQPGINADCDDTDCLFPSFGDDEDGVAIPSTVVAGSTVNITVIASVSGYLDAWMDFNLANGWADAAEHIFINTALTAGPNNLSFVVPSNAVSGQSYVRFRFREIGTPISFDGLVINGEVEDYAIMIQENTTGNIDFGDVPENTASLYPTTLANNGARHTIVPGIFLGSFVDPEPDGQPGPNANCDDTDCLFASMGDDEDGVVLPASVTAGSTVNITVSASVAGFLDAWMDFNLTNSWADAGEHIFTNTALTAGLNNLSFNVPANAVSGQSYVRFRFRDSDVGINYYGLIDNGEVEDYSLNIVESPIEYDFGDTPENISGEYPTTIANNGARHLIVPGIYLGAYVDAEPDGQPGLDANCDDTDCLFPSTGDDEDGVILPDSVAPGQSVNIIVIASVDGFLDAWMDFDLNNSWSGAGENIFTSLPVLAGSNPLTFSVPATAVLGQSYLRFRFRDYASPLGYNGAATNGEVEDYSLLIVQPQFSIDAKVIIGGAVMPAWVIGEPNIMDTVLNSDNYLPLNQPYNDSGAIWYYPGVESVSSIPNTNIVDWVILELRETPGGPASANSSTIINRQVAFLTSNGSVISLDGINLPVVNYLVTQNIYLVVWHRNHLGIMSANPINYDALFTRSYDFTTAATQAYGGINAQTEIAPGYFGMMPGDANADGQIDLLDKNNVWDIIVGETGYLSADFNLDSQVGNRDKDDYWIIFDGKGILVP